MLSLVSALKLAESLEESRAKIYNKYLEVVDFPSGKKALRFLAKAEKMHLQFIKRQSKRLDKGEQMLYSKLHQPEITFPLREDSLKGSIVGLTSDIGIFKVVSDLEKYDVKFYGYLYAQSKNPESKQLFKSMNRMEENHLKAIDKAIKLAENLQKDLMQKNPAIYLKGVTNIK